MLKKELNKITLPPNALIFTYNVVSMYTNVNTEESISPIKEYLLQPATQQRFNSKNPQTIVEAMSLVLQNNRMHFGDLVVHKITGIPMGMSPVPTIVNLFVAIFEAEHILLLIGLYLLLLQRFIDNRFGVCIHDPDPAVNAANWASCQAITNRMGLSWEFTTRSQKVLFMIKNVGGCFITSLYAKPMALYL
jgi:hypothetical protein